MAHPLAWSSRRRPSTMAGMRTKTKGTAAASAMTAKARPRRAAERRQPQPHSEPGDGEEQAGGDRQRRQRRPQALPEDRPARAAQCRRQRRAGGFISSPGAAGVFDRFPSTRSPRRKVQHDNTVTRGQVQGIWRARIGDRRRTQCQLKATPAGGRARSAPRTLTRGRTSAHSPVRQALPGRARGCCRCRPAPRRRRLRVMMARRSPGCGSASGRSSAMKSPDSQTGPTTSAIIRGAPAAPRCTGRMSWCAS